MIQVTLDGSPLEMNLQQTKTMPELVELIKSTIDPQSVISSILINGHELSDVDWRVPLNVQGDAVVEFGTKSKDDFVSDRVEKSLLYVDHIINEFAHTRSCFQEGLSKEGNQALVTAVDDMRAFLNWYCTLLAMLPVGSSENQYKLFIHQIDEIKRTCEQLIQQQLYQSWWALGETIQTRLEPQLESLRGCCQGLAGEVGVD